MLQQRFVLHLLFLLTYMGQRLHAQHTDVICVQQVTGFIRTDKETVLSGAAVLLDDANAGGVSDANGRFEIKNVCPGNHQVKVSYLGYHAATRRIEVKSGQDAHLDFTLQPEVHELTALEVTGQRAAKLHESERSTLNQQQIEAANGATLGERLAQLPGVSMLRTGPTVVKPVIHGMHSNRVLILNNGIRHEGQQWGSEHAPEIDPMAQGRVEVIRGAQTVRYGPEALGGVIILNPADLPDSAGINGRASLAAASNTGMGAASAALSYRPKQFDNLAVGLQGSLRRAGDVRSPTYVLSNTGIEEANFSAQAECQLGKLWLQGLYSQFNSTIGILFSSHNSSLESLKQAIERPRPQEVYDFTYKIANPYQKVSHESATLKATYQLTSNQTLRMQVGRQFNNRSEFDRHRRFGVDNSLAKPALVFYLTTWSAELLHTWQLRQHLALTSGVSFYHGRKSGGFDVTSSRFLLRSLIPNYESQLGGAFTVIEGENGPINWGLGLRGDVKQYQIQQGAWPNEPAINTFQGVSASANAAWQVAPHLAIEAGLSTNARPPSIAELYSRGLHHGVASIEVGNPKARMERLHSATVGAVFDGHNLSLHTNWYVNRIENFLNLVPTPPAALTISGIFPVFAYQQVGALMLGSEHRLTWQITPRLQVLAQATLLRARNTTTNDWLQQMPADRFKLGVSQNFGAVGRLSQISVAVEGDYVARQTRLPGNYLTDTLDFAPAPDGFFILSARVSATLQSLSRSWLLSIEGQNLLNQRYRDYTDRFRYFTDSQGINVFLRVSVPLFSTRS